MHPLCFVPRVCRWDHNARFWFYGTWRGTWSALWCPCSVTLNKGQPVLSQALTRRGHSRCRGFVGGDLKTSRRFREAGWVDVCSTGQFHVPLLSNWNSIPWSQSFYEPTHLIPFPSPKKAHNWPIVHICFIKKRVIRYRSHSSQPFCSGSRRRQRHLQGLCLVTLLPRLIQEPSTLISQTPN